MNLATDNRRVESGEVWSTGGGGGAYHITLSFPHFFSYFYTFFRAAWNASAD